MDYAGSPPSYTPSASIPHHADGAALANTPPYPPSGTEQDPAPTGQAGQHEHEAGRPELPEDGTPKHVASTSPEQQDHRRQQQQQQQQEIFVMDGRMDFDIGPPAEIEEVDDKCDWYYCFAWVVCSFCNLPLGLIALYLASQYILLLVLLVLCRGLGIMVERGLV